MSEQNVTVSLPKNHVAVISGTATAGWTQDVKIKLQKTDDTDIQEFTLQGLNVPLAVTEGGSGFAGQEAIVIDPVSDNDRQLEIIFKTIKTNTTTPVNITGFKSDTHTPKDFVTTYTYWTEDGGDSDYHDTTLVVSVIKTTK